MKTKKKKIEYICDWCGSYWQKSSKKNCCSICGLGTKIVMNSKDDLRRVKKENLALSKTLQGFDESFRNLKIQKTFAERK